MKVKIAIAFFVVITMHLLTVCKVPEERSSVAIIQTVTHTPEGFIEHFEAKAVELMEKSATPGAAIAIVKDNRVVYMKAFGVRKLGTRDSVDLRTIFRLASVSKGFTGTLAAMLASEGKISIEDQVGNYLPDLYIDSQLHRDSITLEHVLSHSTGLPYHAYTNLVEEGWSRSQLLKQLGGVRFAGPPGQFYSYQNVSYGWFEEIVEATGDDSFAKTMQDKIFEPLGMDRASMDYASLTEDQNMAHPHLRIRRGWTPIRVSKTYYNVSSAGGVNASIEDMAKWMLALLGNRPDVISKQTLDRVFEPVIPTYVRRKYFGRWKDLRKASYGLGWRILKYGEDDVAYHGGYVNGYRSEIALNRTEELGICVLVNAPSTFSYKVIPMFMELYDEYKNEKPGERVATVENDRSGNSG